MGIVYQDKGDYDKSLEYYEKSLKIKDIVYQNQPNHPDISLTTKNISLVLQKRGESEKSLESQDKTLKNLEPIFKNQSAETIENFQNEYDENSKYDNNVRYLIK